MSEDERRTWEEHAARLLRERDAAQGEAASLRSVVDALAGEMERLRSDVVVAEAYAAAAEARLMDMAAPRRAVMDLDKED